MKLKLLGLSFFLLLFSFCKKETVDPAPKIPKTSYQNTVIFYFLEIALGFEFDDAPEVTRKWKKPMRVYVSGKRDTALMSELNLIMAEINELASDGFRIERTLDSANANLQCYLGTGREYADRYPSMINYIQDNHGLFFFALEDNEITWGSMWVDIARTDDISRKHLLREELTQSIGLPRDSELYEDSIFQQRPTFTTRYSELDKMLIKLLYHPKVTPGLTEREVTPILKDILTSLGIE